MSPLYHSLCPLPLLRNTIERNCNFEQGLYAVPRANPPLVKTSADLILGMENMDHDYVEPPLELTSEDEEDPGYYRVPRALQSGMSDASSTRMNGSVSSPPPKSSEDSIHHHQSTGSPTSAQRDSTGSDPPVFPTPVNFSETPQEQVEGVGGGIYDMVPAESLYEMEPGSTNGQPPSSSPVYQNADDARAAAEAFRSSSDLLQLTTSSSVHADTTSPLSPNSTTTSSPPQLHTPSSTDCTCHYHSINMHTHTDTHRHTHTYLVTINYRQNQM